MEITSEKRSTSSVKLKPDEKRLLAKLLRDNYNTANEMALDFGLSQSCMYKIIIRGHAGLQSINTVREKLKNLLGV
jgi:hypothetical protein